MKTTFTEGRDLQKGGRTDKIVPRSLLLLDGNSVESILQRIAQIERPALLNRLFLPVLYERKKSALDRKIEHELGMQK